MVYSGNVETAVGYVCLNYSMAEYVFMNRLMMEYINGDRTAEETVNMLNSEAAKL